MTINTTDQPTKPITPEQPSHRAIWPGLLIPAILIAIAAVRLVFSDALNVYQFPGDLEHLLSAVLRLQEGQITHIDFSTPIGSLALWAVAIWPVSFSKALLLANFSFACLSFMLLCWVARTRLSAGLTLLAGTAAIAIALGLTLSGNHIALSYVGFYNRWAWSLIIILLPLLLLQPTYWHGKARTRQYIDAFCLGLAAFTLTFIKISLAATMAPIALIWLAQTREWRTATMALCAYVAFSVIYMATQGGLAGFIGYIEDLINVANAPLRQLGNSTLPKIISNPENLPVFLVLFISILALLRAEQKALALQVAVASLAMTYASTQNYGLELAYLPGLAVCIWAFAANIPQKSVVLGQPAKTALAYCAIVILALQAPIVISYTMSNMIGWHGKVDEEKSLATIWDPNLYFATPESYQGSNAIAADPDPENERRIGRQLVPDCPGNYDHLARADFGQFLQSQPQLSGRSIYTADQLDSMWIFAGITPPKGAQIWWYDDQSDLLSRAELLLVPNCPLSIPVRNEIIDRAIAKDLPLKLMALYKGWQVYEIGKLDE